jgi:predicted transcriptional regulator
LYLLFLSITDNSLLIPEEIEDSFREIWQRLSENEKLILIGLTKTNNSVTIGQIQELVNLPQSELVSSVRSLLRRCLVQTEKATELTIYLLPLFRKMLTKIDFLRK